MALKLVYLSCIVMVNFVNIDSVTANPPASATGAPASVVPAPNGPTEMAVDLGANAAKKIILQRLPEQYHPVLESSVDVASQTIKQELKHVNLRGNVKSFAKGTYKYIKQAIVTNKLALGVVAIEAGVAYILIKDASISRRIKNRVERNLNRTIEALSKDTRITRCIVNQADDCNQDDFEYAMDKFDDEIQSMIEELEDQIEWKKSVMIPASILATSGATAWAGLSIWSLYKVWEGATAVCAAINTLGAGTIGYGAYEEIITYGELMGLIQRLRQVRESEERHLKNKNSEYECYKSHITATHQTISTCVSANV